MFETKIPAVGSVVLYDVPWALYEALVQTSNRARMAYDQGVLEIMSPSSRHEAVVEAIRALILAVLKQFRIDRVATASTTFRRDEWQKGFEADASFYLRDAADIRHRMQERDLDLRVDPAPDLVVEVDLTSRSLDKFPIYAAAEVSEVWRWENDVLTIHKLIGQSYEVMEQSACIPKVHADEISSWVLQSFHMTAPEWEDAVETWASLLDSRQ